MHIAESSLVLEKQAPRSRRGHGSDQLSASFERMDSMFEILALEDVGKTLPVLN
jgi:hypothetical protein